MKKAGIAVLAITTSMMLFGCSSKSSTFPPQQSAIYVSRDGGLYTALVEQYDTSKDYYDETELKTLAQEEADAYNRASSGIQPPVTMESCTMKDGTVSIVYKYATGHDLCVFTEWTQDEENHPESITFTKVSDALKAGAISDGQWMDAKKGNSVALETVTKQKDLPVVLVSGAVTVQVEGPILYCSGSVNILDEYTAEVAEGTAYIVFK